MRCPVVWNWRCGGCNRHFHAPVCWYLSSRLCRPMPTWFKCKKIGSCLDKRDRVSDCGVACLGVPTPPQDSSPGPPRGFFAFVVSKKTSMPFRSCLFRRLELLFFNTTFCKYRRKSPPPLWRRGGCDSVVSIFHLSPRTA